MGDEFNLIWPTFSFHCQELIMNLLETHEFSDITLVSDDQHHFKVHKIVLSASSTTFRKILSLNPRKTSIHLRGVQHEELESILQFLYFGEAKISNERINKFLKVAENLHVKDLNKFVFKVLDEKSEGINDIKNLEKDQIDSDRNHSNYDIVSKRNQGMSGDNSKIESNNIIALMVPNEKSVDINDKRKLDKDKQVNTDENHGKYETNFLSNRSQYMSSEDLLNDILDDRDHYECKQCDIKTASRSALNRHVRTKHEGIRYPCLQCNFQATTNRGLQDHVNTIHKCVRYPCMLCDYQATRKSYLKDHISLKHEGINRYPCQQCDYQAATMRRLQQHINSKHESAVYSCNQCDFQAFTKHYLERHISYKHMGLKYPCQQCNYKATTASSLQQHIDYKHEGITYPCQLCDYKAITTSTLQRHFESKHDGSTNVRTKLVFKKHQVLHKRRQIQNSS